MQSTTPTNLLSRIELPAQTGTAFIVEKDQTLRIIDLEGEQVADLVCFARRNVNEQLSAGRSIDYNEKILFSTGDILYSSLSRPMLTIVDDHVGCHPMLYAPCSQEMFRLSYGDTAPHPNCQDNLAKNLEPFGLRSSQIPTPLNLFMNVSISEQGRLGIHSPRSVAGDHVDLLAEIDLVVAISACSAGACNNYRCTGIAVEIYGSSTPAAPDKPTVHLEPMSLKDWEIAIEQSCSVHADDQVKTGNWDAENALEKVRLGLSKMLPDGQNTDGHHFYNICESDNGIRVGFLWFAVQGRKAFIWDIQIDEKQRRRGYGIAALDTFNDLVREMGLEVISLHVFGHNRPARALYQQFGFREISLMMEKAVPA